MISLPGIAVALLAIVVVVCFACEILKWLSLREAVGGARGLAAGLRYSAELRRLSKESPESPLARRTKALDGISMGAWILGLLLVAVLRLKRVG
jgi:hypothetical protein